MLLKRFAQIVFAYLMLFSAFDLSAQSHVYIGSGSGYTYFTPVYGIMDYGWSTIIYKNDEINRAGKITQIGFYVDNSPNNYIMQNQVIYMGHTEDDTLTSVDPFDTSNMQLVFNNSFTFNGSGLHVVTLQTPFYFDSSKNLVVQWHNYDGDGSSSSYPRFNRTLTTKYLCMNAYQNAAFPWAKGGWTNARPQIRITFASNAFNYSDAGIVAIDSPVTPVSVGSNPVKVTLKNFGTGNLQSASIDWQVNGGTVSTFNWTGNLTPNQTASVTVGNHTFTAGAHSIKAWTKSPNSVTDSMPTNDTFQTKKYAGSPMSGTYTIGSGKNFPNISSAIERLNGVGVSGAVTFSIDPGYYYEGFRINEIKGASAINTITLTSSTGDSSDVTIYQPASWFAENDYVIQLNGADYVTIKNLTLQRDSIGSHSHVVELLNGANHNTIENCRIIGKAYDNSIVEYASIYSHYNTVDSSNTIQNNLFKFGVFGVCFDGTTQDPYYENGNLVQNNILDSFTYTGVFMENQKNCIVRNNQLISHNPSSVTNNIIRGIAMFGYNKNFKVLSNKIIVQGYSRNEGIVTDRISGTSSYPGLVANNFITQRSGTSYVQGLYCQDSRYVNFYFNNINVTSGHSSLNRGIYVHTGTSGSFTGVNIKNNISVNTGGGYAIEISENAVTKNNVNSCDYNDFFTTGTNFTKYNDTDYTTLSAWQNKTNYDQHSISADPIFSSGTDLHVYASLLDSAGTPISGITTDIDGETRNTTHPDIGADEFVLLVNDAGISELVSPSIPCPGTSTGIQVKLENYAIATMNGVKINWSVNGSLQSQYTYSGSLGIGADTTLSIGSMTFAQDSQYNFKFWTSQPNNTTDGNSANDTFAITIFSALKDTATIGHSANATFNSFTEAVTYLNNYGICGPTTFLIDSGYYSGQAIIDSVSTSAQNSISFVSTANDSSQVVIDYPSQSASGENYALQIRNTSNLIFKGITFKRSGLNYYSRVIDVVNHSNNLSFENCQFIGNYQSTNSDQKALFFVDKGLDSNLTIKNSYFDSGSVALELSGNYPVYTTGIEIRENVINNPYAYGYFLRFIDSLIVDHNIISTNSDYSFFYGIYADYLDHGLLINRNTVYAPQATGRYGISIDDYDGNASSYAMISNNFVIIRIASFNSFGIYSNSSDYVKIYHNTVKIIGTADSDGRPFYLSSGSHHIIKNNIFTNFGGGYAIYIGSTTAVDSSDYNNLYTTGNYLGNWSGAKTDLTAWQNASSMDANSKSINPFFYGEQDLHIRNIALDSAGTALSEVTKDIDGEIRNANFPDIGADEFEQDSLDVAIVEWYYPADGCGLGEENIQLKIANFGKKPASNFIVKYQIDSNTAIVSDTVKTTISPKDTIVFTFSEKADYSVNGPYFSRAFTELSGDQFSLNNTIQKELTSKVAIVSFPFFEDFEKENYTFVRSSGQYANCFIDDTAGINRTGALKFEGEGWYNWSGGQTYTDSSQAWVSNVAHHSTAQSCYIDATNLNSLKLRFNLRQEFSFGEDYSWFRVLVNDTIQIFDEDGITNFQPKTSVSDPFDTITFDLSPFAGTTFTLSFQAANRYDNANGNNGRGDNAYLDNILLVAPPQINLGVDKLLCPGLTDTLDAGYRADFSYEWYKTGNSTRLDTTQKLIVNTSGTYYVIVTDSFGYAGTDTINVSIYGTPTLNAGVDDTICENSSASLNATATNYTQLLWTTNGNGSFQSAASLGTTYTPGSMDITNGFAQLVLTISGPVGCSSDKSDTVIIYIDKSPVAFAGQDDSICENTVFNLNGNITNSTSYFWSTSGDGSFNDSSSLTTTYTHGNTDLNSGSVNLILKASNGVCLPDYDTLELSIQKLPTIQAGVDDTLCENTTLNLSASAANYSYFVWSTLGDGSFNDSNAQNTTYIHGSQDRSNGSVNLIAYVDGIGKCQVSKTDTLVLFIDKFPTVYAGIDDTVCENVQAVLNASASNYSSILWSSLGDGSFSSANSLTSNYTHGQTDLNNGMVNLVLKAEGSDKCPFAFDTLELTIQPALDLYVREKDSICEGQNYQLSATVSNYSAFEWQSLGDGYFSDSTSQTAVYYYGSSDFQNEKVKIVAKVNPIVPCQNLAYDTLELTIFPDPDVQAGLSDSICEIDTIFLNATANYNQVVWRTSGDGNFNDTTILNPEYYPGNVDITNGFVDLVITAFGPVKCGRIATDTVRYYIFKEVEITLNDTLICDNYFYATQATLANYSSVTWSTYGDGSFDNKYQLNTKYFPGTNDKSNKKVDILIQANGLATCPPRHRMMTLSIIPHPDFYVKANDTICSSESYYPASAKAENYDWLNWTTNGDGTFDNPMLVKPTYTPGTNDILKGRLTLTIFGKGLGPCLPDRDTVELIIIPQPIVNAGLDRTICENDTMHLHGFVQNDVNFFWRTNGDGSFDDINSLNPVYTPGNSDINKGKFKLKLIVDGNSPCAMDSDIIQVFVNKNPVMSGLSDQSICENETFQSSISIQNATQTLWSTKGDGYFNDSVLENITYYPGNSDILSKTVELKIWAKAAKACTDQADSMTLTINSLPNVNLGKDTTICAGNLITLNAGNGFDKYLWQDNSDKQTLDVDSNGVGVGSKTIWVMVTNDNCSNSDMIIITFKKCGSVNDLGNLDVKIYPNPAKEKLFIELDRNHTVQQVEMLDMLGKIVLTKQVEKNSNLLEISVNELSKGSYLLKLTSEEGSWIGKVVVE